MDGSSYPSAIPLHILPTIPGSACASPVQGVTPPSEDGADQPAAGPSTPSSIYYNATGTPSPIPSRRSSLSAYTMADSYFPNVVSIATPLRSCSPTHGSPSEVLTPSDRPKPSPLNIPDEADGEPLFSNYPLTPNNSGLPSVTASSSKGKGKALSPPSLTLQPFVLANISTRKRRGSGHVTAELGSPQRWKPLPARPDEAPARATRKRAFTVNERPLPAPPSESDDDVSPANEMARTSGESSTWETADAPALPVRHTQVRQQRKRRASLGSFTFPRRRTDQGPEGLSFVDDNLGPSVDAHQPFHVPYSYLQPAQSEYTLQSVSTITTVRPLNSPMVQAPPRRSSLASHDSAVLGLSNLSLVDPSVLRTGEIQDSPVDTSASAPLPPMRRSSLDLALPEGKAEQQVTPGDVAFIPGADAASVSATETSQSAYALSPTSSGRENHPLSSATTSLSRSAKSGKEGDDEVSDEDLAIQGALKLQRSLEIEVVRDRRRRRLTKRRMIVVELVETEVAYTEDLKALVHIYLPQLAALPFVDDKMVVVVSRNISDLLFFHVQLAARMVEVLKEEALSYVPKSEDSLVEFEKVERVVRRLAALFVEDVSGFKAYNSFCAGSLAAMDILRQISERPEWQQFERRCQIISLSTTPVSLAALLADLDSQSSSAPVEHHSSMVLAQRARLQFRDLLIMPVQRVCRYPLLLASLLGTASTPTTEDGPESYGESRWDVGVDIERALGAMRSVAEDADEAQKKKVMEARSALIIQRLESHPLLTPTFMTSLGYCVLAGALDVLHHHPIVAPLAPPVKVKYMAAFLYRGYLILAKVKKGKTYEAKHFLPLEVFELIDITEGFLPHSVRLTLREHNFDLAASCEAEKAVWATALCDARDESTVPPFELPASVSPFAARSRRFSSMGGPSATATVKANHRHSMAGQVTLAPSASSPEAHDDKTLVTPAPSTPTSPISPTYQMSPVSVPPVTPERRHASLRPPPTILLRRASVGNRMALDRNLADIFSEACSSARSKAQIHHALFHPDVSHSPRHRLSMRDASVLRRRRSFVDSHGTVDVVAAGPVKGQVMTVGRARSGPGWKRSSWDGQETIRRGSSVDSEDAFRNARGSSAVPSGNTTEGEATASDFGTLLGASQAGVSRNPSLSSSVGGDTTIARSHGSSSDSPPPHTFRRNVSHGQLRPLSSYMPSMPRRKSASASGHIYMRPKSSLRSISVPVSPRLGPTDATEEFGEPEGSPSFSMLDSGDRNRSQLITNRDAREEAEIYNRGAGFTNVADSPLPVSLLKRSLSFASRGRSKSGQSLVDAWVANSEHSPQQSSTSLAISSPPSRRTSPGELSPTSPTIENDFDDDGQPRGLRRKRSLRLFPQLARFTPMGSSKA